MGLQRFEDFIKDDNKTEIKKTSENKQKNIVKNNKVFETAFIVDDNYKVKLTFDVPKSLVDEYINKVKQESGKNPLDNFNKNEIAEEMIQYLIKSNLTIDNLPASFSVGTEENIEQETIEQDLEDVEDDFEIPYDEEPNDEIDFDSVESDEMLDIEDIDLESDNDDNETEDGFETIEFDEDEDEDEDITDKQSIGDYKKKHDMVSETEEEEETIKPDEEYDIDELYKQLGINNNLYETIDFSQLYKNNF